MTSGHRWGILGGHPGLPGYLFFFFSFLASFFSLAVFCGFFFAAFFVSCDLDMWSTSLMKGQYLIIDIIYHHQIQITSLMATFEKDRNPEGETLLGYRIRSFRITFYTLLRLTNS